MQISKLTLGTVQLGLKYGIANRIGKPNLESSYDILMGSFNSCHFNRQIVGFCEPDLQSKLKLCKL